MYAQEHQYVARWPYVLTSIGHWINKSWIESTQKIIDNMLETLLVQTLDQGQTFESVIFCCECLSFLQNWSDTFDKMFFFRMWNFFRLQWAIAHLKRLFVVEDTHYKRLKPWALHALIAVALLHCFLYIILQTVALRSSLKNVFETGELESANAWGNGSLILC